MGVTFSSGIIAIAVQADNGRVCGKNCSVKVPSKVIEIAINRSSFTCRSVEGSRLWGR